jgi:hypothetical protein
MTNPHRTTLFFLGLATAAAIALSAPAAASGFPDGPPNDPEYDRVEEGGPGTCLERGVTDEQFYLYDFIPRCTPRAEDPEGAAGMSVNAAWSDYSVGTNATRIAFVEGGINWHTDAIEELVDKVYVNRGELPFPQGPDGAVDGDATPYDRNDDGRFSASDYAEDPRVTDANGNGLVDPEDLIVAFSDGVDDDRNGFPDDVSGWDFYNDQNNPSAPDTTYTHANSQMKRAAAETDNGLEQAGVCPECTLVPVKATSRTIPRTQDLADAWAYASAVDADVVVSPTADVGYSPYMERVVEGLWDEGVAMVESSTDLDATHHQGGMFHPHVVPANSMVADTAGEPVPATQNAGTTTYRERSGYTGWGPHNDLTVPTAGGTTSEANPVLAGALGLTVSYGQQAYEAGRIDAPLTGPEAIQVLRNTASDVDDPSLAWPSNEGWDPQYGYGRPNLHEALGAVHDGEIPPAPSIHGPDWYSLYDPTEQGTVEVTGEVPEPRDTLDRWVLEVAPGQDPSSGDWRTAATGDEAVPEERPLGTVSLDELPASFWADAYELSGDKSLSTSKKYVVTLRLRAQDAAGLEGEDRRAISVHRDETWVDGFPREADGSVESAVALADLQDRGRDAIVYGSTNGTVHALDATTGEELPGWPVHTAYRDARVGVPGVDPGREPVLGAVAVGDVDAEPGPEVAVSTLPGSVYVFDEDGELLPGWPRSVDEGAWIPDSPRPQLEITRLPKAGATAGPVLADLDGDPAREVLQAGWDGHVHAYDGDGTPLHGWPVNVTLGHDHEPPPGHTTARDHRLILPLAVADLDGNGDPEVVVPTQFSDIVDRGVNPGGAAHVAAYHHDGTPVGGWPVELPSIFYAYATEYITEGPNGVVAADVDGDGTDEVAAGPSFGPTYLVDGDGSIRTVYGPSPGSAAAPVQGTWDPTAGVQGHAPADGPVSFSGEGAFAPFGPGEGLSFIQPGIGFASTARSLLTPGSGWAPNQYLRVHEAATGASAPGFPAESQGFAILSGPVVADVTGDGASEVVLGGDTNTLHGYTATGDQASTFPKFTTGWTLQAPSVGDVDGDDQREIVTGTREGTLMAWRTPASVGDSAPWGAYQGGPQRTGHHGPDPAAATDPGASPPTSSPGLLPLAGLAAGAVVPALRGRP